MTIPEKKAQIEAEIVKLQQKLDLLNEILDDSQEGNAQTGFAVVSPVEGTYIPPKDWKPGVSAEAAANVEATRNAGVNPRGKKTYTKYVGGKKQEIIEEFIGSEAERQAYYGGGESIPE